MRVQVRNVKCTDFQIYALISTKKINFFGTELKVVFPLFYRH